MKVLTLYFSLLLALPVTACKSDCDNIKRPKTEAFADPDRKDKSNKKNHMKIKMIVNGLTITATMEDNAAAREFIARLPLEIEFEDYNRTEKIFYPSPKLNINGVKKGCSPQPGDITIYAPWGNIAIFYKNWPQSNDLIKIGRIDGDNIEAFKKTGNIKIYLQRIPPTSEI